MEVKASPFINNRTGQQSSSELKSGALKMITQDLSRTSVISKNKK